MNLAKTAIPVLIACAAGACGAPDVTLRGQVTNDGGAKERPLANAEVRVLDGDGVQVGSTTTNDNGRFNLRIKGGTRIYAIIDADGYVPTSFTGGGGLEPTLRIPNGTLFAVPEDKAQGYRDQFAGCPGIDDGAFMVGDVRVINLTEQETGDNPLVQTASLEWFTTEADSGGIEACYLDAEGRAYDPGADETGASGMYLIADVPPGLGRLGVRYDVVSGAEGTTVTYDTYMPEDGVISRFPTFVEFETPL